MRKIWSKIAGYLAVGLAFCIAGMVFMYKLIGDKVEVNIKKVKNKRVGSATTTIPINIEGGKPKREQKKAIRQSKREQRRSK